MLANRCQILYDVHRFYGRWDYSNEKKIYKLFLILIVSLSLGSAPIAQNEIAKMLETLSKASVTQIQETDDDEKESGELT